MRQNERNDRNDDLSKKCTAIVRQALILAHLLLERTNEFRHV